MRSEPSSTVNVCSKVQSPPSNLVSLSLPTGEYVRGLVHDVEHKREQEAHGHEGPGPGGPAVAHCGAVRYGAGPDPSGHVVGTTDALISLCQGRTAEQNRTE